MKSERQLNFWYSAQQVFYYAGFCAVVGYASVFMLAKGFSNSGIGMVLAAGNVLALFLQPLLATWCDRHPEFPLQRLVLICTAIIIACSLALWLLPVGTAAIAAVMVILMTVCTTLMPFMNSLAFVFERLGMTMNYGAARGVGSGAYALSSLAVGRMAESLSADVIPVYTVIMTILMAVCVFLYRLGPEAPQASGTETEKKQPAQLSFGGFVHRYLMFTLFLAGAMLVYLDHAFINNFFIQVILPLGGTSADMGTAVFIAASLEVPVMTLFRRIERRFGCENIIRFSIFMFMVKHIVTYFAASMAAIYAAQLLQTFAYALFMPASVYYVNEIIDLSDQVKGQSMVTIAMTAAGIIADLLGGIMIDRLGMHETLLVTAALSVIGTVIVFMTAGRADIHKGETGRQGR